jgi:hypothetical protein
MIFLNENRVRSSANFSRVFQFWTTVSGWFSYFFTGSTPEKMAEPAFGGNAMTGIVRPAPSYVRLIRRKTENRFA